MSNYPPSQYGGNYGSHDQNNLPYLPPAYPPQYYPQQGQQGGHGQVNANASYNVYGYNPIMPGFNPIPTPTPGMSQMPLFQGWNQDHRVATPTFSGAPQHSPYTGYAPVQEQQSQYYSNDGQSNWQQPDYSTTASYGQQHVDQGEYHDNVMMDTAPAPEYADRRSSSAGKDRYSRASTNQQAVVQKSPIERTPSSDFYTQSKDTRPPPSRRDSDPYSPHLSPVATVQSPAVKEHAAPAMYGNRESTPRVLNGLRKEQATTATNAHAVEPAHTKTPIGSSSATVGIRSVEEGKKSAQGALLALGAHEIGYDALLAEGFRKDILDKLYGELGLPFPRAYVANGNAAASPPVPANGSLAVSTGTSNSERLTASPRVSTVKSANVIKTSNVAAPSGFKVVSEKDRILQEKIEAFKKSKLAKEAGRKESAVDKISKDATPSTSSMPIPVFKEAQGAKAVTTATAPISTVVTLEKDDTCLTSPSTVVAQAQEHTPANQSLNSAIVIPGLFMASTSAKPAAVHSEKTESSNFLDASKKRPLTSGIQGSINPSKPAKRPFGFSRSRTNLVIDVSEDDDDSQDEDVAMDIDSDPNQDSPLQATILTPHRFSSATPVKQQKANATAKRMLSNGNSATSTVSSGTNSKLLSGAMDLQSHERTIEELKRLIAEKEARRRLKETPSGTQTPSIVASSRIDAPVPTAQASTSPPSTSLVQSQLRHDLVSGNSFYRAESMDLDSPTSDTELSNDIENAGHDVILRAREVEQKEQAARELQAALQKLQADAEAAQRALQSAKEKESQLQAKRKRRSERVALIAHESEVRPAGTTPIFNAISTVDGPEKLKAIAGQEKSQHQLEEPETQTPEHVPVDEGSNQSRTDVTAVLADVDSLGDNTAVSPSAMESSIPDPVTSTSEIQIPPADVRPAAHEQISSPTMSSSSTPIAAPQNEAVPGRAVEKEVLLANDSENRPSPVNKILEHELLVPVLSAPELLPSDLMEDITKSADNDMEATLQEAIRAQEDLPVSDPEEGEVDMDMEMSSPMSVARSNPLALDNIQANTEVLVAEVVPGKEEAEEEEDDYEPPDATPPVESPPFSPAPPGEDPMVLESGPMIDDMPLISESSSNDLVDFQTPTIPLGTVAQSESKSVAHVKHVAFFTPYQSPLRRFHAYRFHPQFRSEIAGGLRSLTYSNKIDAKNELCRYESLGGICNDSSCKESHFKDMSIPDVTILGELGSLAQFVGGPRYDEFCKGLRALIANLPKEKRKDFDIVAHALLEYRAKFLADDSKVLPLEGVTV